MLIQGSPEKLQRFYHLEGTGNVIASARLVRPEALVSPKCQDLATVVKLASSFVLEQEQEFDMFIDLIRRMLVYNPADRITPENALRHPFCMRAQATNTPTSAIRRSVRLGLTSPKSAPAQSSATTPTRLHRAQKSAGDLCSPITKMTKLKLK